MTGGDIRENYEFDYMTQTHETRDIYVGTMDDKYRASFELKGGAVSQTSLKKNK